MNWIEYEKRKPKSAGLYAISKKLLDPVEGLLIAYFDGVGFIDPYTKQGQEKVYWDGAMWSVMEWGEDQIDPNNLPDDDGSDMLSWMRNFG